MVQEKTKKEEKEEEKKRRERTLPHAPRILLFT
jgi:hypothetical protein